MALPPDVRLARAYTDRYNRLRAAASTSMARAWDRQAGLDDAAAAQFTQSAARISLAAQAQTAAGVDGYVTAMFTLIGEQSTTVGYDLDALTGGAVRAGAAPEDVYQRGIVTARTGVSEGSVFAEAMAAGRARVLTAVQTDMALTQRQAISTDRRVVGYRRVLTGKSCALCATASTQRYHSGNLAPLHGSCDCGVAPIIGTHDPGHVINKQLVRDLKSAEKITGDADYWKSRHIKVDENGRVTLPDIAVRQHGELGPVLTDRSHDFTSQADLVA